MWKISNYYDAIVVTICLFLSTGIVATAQTPEPNRLTLPSIWSNPAEHGTFEIALKNVDEVFAGQLRFTYAMSAGIEIADVSLTPRTDGYEPPIVQSKTIDPTTAEVLIIFYSLQKATITPGEGAILRVHYRTTDNRPGYIPLTMSEIVLADPENRPLLVQVEHGSAMSVLRRFSAFNVGQEPDARLNVPEPTPLTSWILGLGLIWLVYKQKYRQKS